MTGTVTGATAYQRYAGGQWRVYPQIVRRFRAAHTSAQLGAGRSGSRLSGRFQQFRFSTLRHETSSRGWLLSERSRG